MKNTPESESPAGSYTERVQPRLVVDPQNSWKIVFISNLYLITAPQFSARWPISAVPSQLKGHLQLSYFLGRFRGFLLL